MKADQLIPGNWYYHYDVLVKFITNVKTDQKGYRFERAFRDTYSAFSLNADQIENEITHELMFVSDTHCDCLPCCLDDQFDECIAVGNCSSSFSENIHMGYYIKLDIKS